MDADIGVVSCTSEVLRISAGQASIAWVTAGLYAVVRIPVVGAVLVTQSRYKSCDVAADFYVLVNISVSPVPVRAGSLNVFLNIFFSSACLVGYKDPV